MTAFVRITRLDDEGTVQFLNMDHVLAMEQRERGTTITLTGSATHRLSVLETPDEILSGRLPRIPQYGGPPTPSQLIHWVNQLAEKVKEASRPNETQILLNLEMVRRLLET